jgi:hypothetical protein
MLRLNSSGIERKGIKYVYRDSFSWIWLVLRGLIGQALIQDLIGEMDKSV